MFRRSLLSTKTTITGAAAASLALATSSSSSSLLFSAKRPFHQAGGGGGPPPKIAMVSKDDTPDWFFAFPEMDQGKAGRAAAMPRHVEYVCCEKIHGSNTGVVLLTSPDGAQQQLKVQKRNNAAGENELFFGYQCLLDEWREQSRFIYRQVQLYEKETDAAKIYSRAKAAAAKSAEAAAAGGDASAPSSSSSAESNINNFSLDADGLPVIPRLVIYGELFGGHYDHSDAPPSTQRYKIGGVGPDRQVTAVQKDAFPQYSRALHFCAFDILYSDTYASLAPKNVQLRLPFDRTQQIFGAVPAIGGHQFFYLRPLVRGSLDKCFAFDIQSFTTTVPMQLGLGNAYLRNNRAEGVVIRAVNHGAVDDSKSGIKTIVKVKSSFFQELRHREKDKDGNPVQRQDPMADVRVEAVKKCGPQLADPAAIFPLGPERAALLAGLQLLRDHIVPNRLSSLMSKIGPDAVISGSISQSRLAYLLAQDALKDFIKEHAEQEIVCASLMARREMARYLLFDAKKLVAEQWANLSSGMVDEQAQQAEAEGAAAASE